MVNIQKPKGEFRRYILWKGSWRHVYIVSTYYQQTLIGEPTKMVEFRLVKMLSVLTALRDLGSMRKNQRNAQMSKNYLDNNHQ